MESRLHLEGVRQVARKSHDEIVMLGGGSRSDLWCQIFADVLCRPVYRCETADTAALGAAVHASVSHGVYPSFERATQQMTRMSRRFEPGPNSELYEELYRDVYRGMFFDLQDRSQALSRIREATSTGPIASFRPPQTLAPPADDSNK